MTVVHYSLPGYFLGAYKASIDAWLESRRPGDTLLIYIGRAPGALSDFVSHSYVERHTIELRAVPDESPVPGQPGRYEDSIRITPADEHSVQLVNAENALLMEAAVIRTLQEQQLVTLQIDDMLAGTGVQALHEGTQFRAVNDAGGPLGMVLAA